MLARRTYSSKLLLAVMVALILATTNAAFSQTNGKSTQPKSKVEQQPWQKKPYDLAEELDENKFR